MATATTTRPATPATKARVSDRPPERLVRHVFWKYPILAAVLLLVVASLAALVGSPNYPRASIADAAQSDPGGAVLAFTQELDGTSSSAMNAAEFGMGDPGQVFVVQPLQRYAPLLGSDVAAALSTYTSATSDQAQQWAAAYDKALGTIMPQGGSGDMGGGGAGGMGGVQSPDYGKIDTLQGDFGPVPTMVKADLQLAQGGYLEQDLQAVDPGHSFHLVNIWLYDHPALLNTAVAQGLTDDQWGMVKERGFAVGPWYLIIPAVIHVELPNGSTGQGFVLDNLAFAFLLLFLVPLIPGIRSLPRYLRLYRLIYRYPTKGEFDRPEMQERHGATHGDA
jgi:hypothetical protein